MNRIYNLVWSKTKECWLVVSERVKGNGKVPSSPLLSIAVVTAMFASGGDAFALDSGALPTGGQIASGSATISTVGNRMTVNQSTQKMIANWQRFNIGESAAVRFNQPNSSAAALNRIADQNPTQIMGSLSSNGNVFLLNQSGIVFGKSAKVDVGGLVASSLDMLDSDFLAGKYSFSNTGSAGSIRNQGSINASNGGVVALIAPKVINDGSITANSGSVLLAAGNQLSVDFTGDGLISYTVDKGAVEALVENNGLIKADGGLVVMTAQAAAALKMANATNTGVIEARTIENRSGRILLLSDMQNGQANVGGTLDASAPKGGDGGFIETSGNKVKIADGTVVTTLAPQGNAGTWLIDPDGYTIAAYGGDISGLQLSSNLATGNVSLASTSGSGDDGNINVNDTVSWSANKLTLTARHDININAVMTAGGSSTLAMNTGDFILGSYFGAVRVGIDVAADGTCTFKGRVDFPGRTGKNILTINGDKYNVINSLGAEGSKTENDLQGIQGAENWLTNDISGHWALGDHIDASQTSIWGGFQPISPSSGHNFQGSFNGLGHTISNLMISQRSTDDYVGLFGTTAEGAKISNVGLVNETVFGHSYVGGLVGLAENAKITNVFMSGSVTGRGDRVGGLVGQLLGFYSWSNDGQSVIQNCYTKGTVSGAGNMIGGLVGEQMVSAYDLADSSGHSSIFNSDAMVDVTATDGTSVGGLVGMQHTYDPSSGGLSIENCHATGNVIGRREVGGLVGTQYVDAGGSNGAEISSCFFNGNVTGSGDRVGGLLGYSRYGTIVNSYATAIVTGDVNGSSKYKIGEDDAQSGTFVGGLVGYVLHGHLQDCFATGKVYGYNCVGGLAGEVQTDDASFYHVPVSMIDRCYSQSDVSGYAFVGGLVGLNEVKLDTCFATGSVSGSTYVGGLVGMNFNVTIDNCYATGSVSNNTIISGNTEDIAQIALLEGSGAEIGGFGGLAGVVYGGKISNSYATGNVSGKKYTGGLAGSLFEGEIINCYSTGRVDGESLVGGLVGGAFGEKETKIEQSYATGAVTANIETAGGLVGFNNAVEAEYKESFQWMGLAGGLLGVTVGAVVEHITGMALFLHVGLEIGKWGGELAQEKYNEKRYDEWKDAAPAITNCYAIGNVRSSSTAGGLIGSNMGAVSNCYSWGGVSVIEDKSGHSSSVYGALFGADTGEVTAVYFNTDNVAPGMAAVAGSLPNSKFETKGYGTVDFQHSTTIWGKGGEAWDLKNIWEVGNGSKPELKAFLPSQNKLIQSGNWSTAENWSLKHVPTIFETASIGNKTVDIDRVVMANNLVGDVGGQLNFNGRQTFDPFFFNFNYFGQTVRSLALNTSAMPLVVTNEPKNIILTGQAKPPESALQKAVWHIAGQHYQTVLTKQPIHSRDLLPSEMPMPVAGFAGETAALEKLSVLVLSEPGTGRPGAIGVRVPGYLDRPNAVFGFELPDKVRNTISGSGVAETVTLLDGSPLPSWLEYDSGSKRFTASNVPHGSMPLSVLIQSGGQRWAVEIMASPSNTVALK